MFILLTCLYILIWLFLYSFYLIFIHYNVPLFTMCCVPDKQFVNTIMFILLPLIYILTYIRLRKYKEIPITMKLTLICSCIVSALLAILTYPLGAPDMFNYIISCKLAYFHHLNPYIHTFSAFTTDPLRNYSNTVNMTLGYGPLWLLLCYIPSMFMDFTSILSMVIWYKAYNCLFLAGTAILIYHYQDSDRKWISLYLFLMNPLILFEGPVNGHNDIMMTFFLIFAIFKLRHASIYSLPLLMLSAMIKFFTLPLFPLFIIESYRKHRHMNKIILSCLLSFLIMVILFVPYWDRGNMIKGMLSGMSSYHNTGGLSVPSMMKGYMR